MAAVTGYLGAFKIASDVTTPISNENLGTGNDSATVFYLDNTMPDWDNVIIRQSDTVLNTTMVRNVDYEISPRGVVTFTVAVSDSRRVQGDYSYFAAHTTLGGFTNWTVDLTCDMLDSTEFDSSGWRTFKAGLKGWTGTAEGYWLEGEEDLISLYMDTDEKVVLQFYFNDTTSDYLTGWGYISGLSASVPVGELVTKTLTFQGDDLVSFETTTGAGA